MPNVGLNPSRRAVLDVMIGLGANIEIHESTETCNEPVADMRVNGGFGKASDRRTSSTATSSQI